MSGELGKGQDAERGRKAAASEMRKQRLKGVVRGRWHQHPAGRPTSRAGAELVVAIVVTQNVFPDIASLGDALKTRSAGWACPWPQSVA